MSMKITSKNALIAYTGSPQPSIQYIPVAMTGQQSLMAFHRHLLEDEVRTQHFIDAIAAVVQKDDIVVDLGTGTGILALASARAGARRVHAIEANEIIHGAREVARVNGAAETIVFEHCEASRVTLPEPVDVVVSECIGIMGPGDMMATVAEFARKWLRPGGKTIPERITLHLVPVESSLHWDYVDIWQKRPYYGIDFSPLQPIAHNNVYVAWFDEGSFLCEPLEVASRVIATDDVANISVHPRFRLQRGGVLHGLCGWFEVDLGGGVTLSSAPNAPATIWQQTFFPLERPVEVNEDTVVEVELTLSSRPIFGKIPSHFAWNTTVIRGSNESERVAFEQSTLKRLPQR